MATDTTNGSPRVRVETADALDFLRGLAADSVDLVFTSPKYPKARSYGLADGSLATDAWVEWIRPIVVEACRVSKGLAFFNVSDVVTDGVYGGGPEYLFADLTRLDGLVGMRPYVWVKSGPADDDRGNGTPGSGGKHFHRNDYEPVYGYAEPAKLPPPWSYNLAFGRPPEHPAGGKMSHRRWDGRRKGITIAHTKRGHNGVMQKQVYTPPMLSNAGNVLRVRVGGHHLGSPLAHDNEAPMPLGVAERFVCWYCPPEGTVVDPFCGSGTTAHAAVLHGRRFLGCDLRASMTETTQARTDRVTPDLFSAA